MQARDLFKESLARWRVIGTLQWKGVADCLEGLAGVCARRRRFEEATRLFGAAEALREFLTASPSQHARMLHKETYALLHAELGEVAFAAAWMAGHELSAEEAVDYVLALPALSAPAPDQPDPLAPSPATYPAGLTEREVEVLGLLAQGLTYAQIAEKLIISRRTVNTHMISIYSKLDVHTRFEATRFAIDHHLT
jgi:DNA-binding NarL/FixJ family response regulator